METLLTTEMIKSLSEGNLGRFAGFVLIFVFIWIEVRGLKKSVDKLTSTIAKGFAEGDARFQKLEQNQSLFDHRLTEVEHALKPLTGG